MTQRPAQARAEIQRRYRNNRFTITKEEADLIEAMLEEAERMASTPSIRAMAAYTKGILDEKRNKKNRSKNKT